MQSNRSIFLSLCLGLGALALNACSGGGNTNDASTDGGMDGSVTLPDGNVIDVHEPTGTWTSVTSGTTNDLISVWGSGPTDVYAIASRSSYHFTGTSWPETTTDLIFESVSGTSANDVWICAVTSPESGSGSVGNLVFSHDTGGGFMDDMPGLSPNLAFINFSSASEGWVVGPNGSAAHYNGTAWSGMNNGIGATENLVAVDSIAAGDAVAVGEHITRWNGTTWTEQPNANTTQKHAWYAVYALDANDVWVVGQFGFMQHWDGAAWTDVDPGNDANGGVLSLNLNGVWAAASNDVWAIGDMGTIIHFNGVHWSLVAGGGGSNGPTTNNLRAIWGSGAGDVWAVGDRGTIVHYQ